MLPPSEDGRLALSRRFHATAILSLLSGALLCLAVAPLAMPDSYSMIENAVSESAAQGITNAWVARLGFLGLGFAVLLAANTVGSDWGVWGRAAFRSYGAAIIAAAAFAHMPWEDVPYDRFEDFLHSVAAGIVGMGFIVGVLLVTMQRPRGEFGPRVFDWFAIAASLAISMLMFNLTAYAGAMQRFMFLIGMVWFGLETARWWRIPLPAAASAERSDETRVSALRT